MAKDLDKKRIVITGVGVVAPNGIGKEEFWQNCLAGVSGIKPITLFDVSKYRCKYAGEISNFQPEKYLGPKGLRNLDRTTLLALVAAKLAIDDSRLGITDDNRNEIGVVLGSTMGSVHSISEFDKEGLREGPRYVNPARFPNTVINSPASQVAIRFGLRGLNATISTGFTAGLDAIGYALDMLQLGRAQTLLVGGVEELCIQTFLGFYKLGFLATAQNGTPPLFAPFDARRCGTVLGEGAAFFVLEPMEQAMARGSTIYAEVLGYATGFSPDSMLRYDPAAEGLKEVLRNVLDESGVSPDEIDFVSASANSTKVGDAAEASAIQAVLDVRTTTVSAVKSILGESFSAGETLQLAAAVGALVEQRIPPMPHWQQPDVACQIGRVSSSARTAKIRRVLISGFGPTGSASAVVIESAGD